MAKLIYSYLASLDGYIADEGGNFNWAEPDEEVLDFINETGQSIRTYLYGRKLYEMMIGWETDPALLRNRPRAKSSRGSGSGPKRSSSRAPSMRSLPSEPGSSARSIPRPSERSKQASIMTWQSPAPTWRPPHGG